jgi:hypothetical protein
MNEIFIYPSDLSDDFLEKLSDQSGIPIYALFNKTQLNNINAHLKYLGVNICLLETSYIDRHYAADYRDHNVLCHADFEIACLRLNFFNTPMDLQEFESGFNKLLESQISEIDKTQKLSIQALQEYYEGFMVIKRLPEKVIGRTVLNPLCKTDSSSETRSISQVRPTSDGTLERKEFPPLREYINNVFGIELKNYALAFQEQDGVSSACATESLWVAFQSTGHRMHHKIPTPNEITLAATKSIIGDQVFKPGKGLNVEQMSHAIRDVGFDPLGIKVSLEDYYETELFKANVYAYVHGKHPVVVGLHHGNAKDNNTLGISKKPDRHAITIVGCKLNCDENYYGNIYDRTSKNRLGHMKLTSSRINSIYVHDDQIGPYSQMVIDRNSLAYKDVLKTSLEPIDIDNKPFVNELKPYFLLIPMHPLFRTPFSRILHDIEFLSTWIHRYEFKVGEAMVLAKDALGIKEEFEWDIYCLADFHLKAEIRKSGNLHPNDRRQVLLMELPKMIWRATALHQGQPRLDFIFDAMAINQGTALIHVIEYLYDKSKPKNLLNGFRILFKDIVQKSKEFSEPIRWGRSQAAFFEAFMKESVTGEKSPFEWKGSSSEVCHIA